MDVREAETNDGELLDLVVIGAGPHALSLLTRLVDDSPDLLTEQERVHVVKKAGSRARTHKDVRKHLKRHFDGPKALPRTVVVDAAPSIEPCRSSSRKNGGAFTET